MRLLKYITEDFETVRDYKKAIFDLKVAMGEWEFHKSEPVPKNAEEHKLFQQKELSLKLKVIALKEKIMKLSKTLGESGTKVPEPEGMKELFDKIPEKDSKESQILLKKREGFSK